MERGHTVLEHTIVEEEEELWQDDDADHHGWFCVGCCWALMATMLAVGVSSVWWMMALTVATFAEQTVAGGDALRLPIGVALMGGGLLSMSRLA